MSTPWERPQPEPQEPEERPSHLLPQEVWDKMVADVDRHNDPDDPFDLGAGVDVIG